MTQKIIRPAQAGAIVRRPDNTRPLAAKGEPVDWSVYWQRRLGDGDIELVPNSVQEAPTADAEQPEKPVAKEGKK